MLRITTSIRPDGTTVALEGRLAGPWVDELRASWRSLATTRDASSIRVDLDAVTFIDTAGKARGGRTTVGNGDDRWNT